MDYSWKNDDLWTVRITQDDFAGFVQPYLGNGFLGTRFDKLVIGTDRNPLISLSRFVYDGGKQPCLPAWNHVFLTVAGVAYTPENGSHKLEQTLDIRDGTVSLLDQWEYLPGKTLRISILMFIPRTFGHAAYLSFGIHNLTEEANLFFGILGQTLARDYRMAFSTTGDSVVTGDYQTVNRGRPVTQALQWSGEGFSEAHVKLKANGVELFTDLEPGNVRLELFHFLSVGAPGSDPHDEAVRGANHLHELGGEELRFASAAEWKRLWATGLAFRCKDAKLEKRVLLDQFYLLCSLETHDEVFGPLGLSGNGWKGSQMWDIDFYIFRAVLPLWPDYARALVSYRYRTLEKAKEHARVSGYRGAWYPWMGNEDGENVTPPRYNDELHVNIWIALAAWEYFVVSGDRQFLETQGWPILNNIGEFFLSRVEDIGDGLIHLACVVGPDESVAEVGQVRVNDNFLTNYGLKKLFETIAEAARVLNLPLDPKWEKSAGLMYLPAPDAQGIIPEYRAYNGHGIKQADLILAFYPLGYPADDETILKNIEYYRARKMFAGPMMSVQIASCLWMRMGEKEKGLRMMMDVMQRNLKGPHDILFEWPGNDNNVFFTGIGGELQALIYGYYGADLNTLDKIPRIAEYMENVDD